MAATKIAKAAVGSGRALLVALRESLQPPGARGLYRQQATSLYPWSLGEVQLNICMVCELFVQILASGLGALALVWATVVLLGGFSTSLAGTDFWLITAIVFIQTARVVGINVSPEADFFNQVPSVFLELRRQQRRELLNQLPLGRRRPTTSRTGCFYVDFINVMTLFGKLVLPMPVIAGLGCISISIYRLIALLSNHRDNSNVFRALMLFYALVVLQGALFIVWLFLRLYRSYFAYLVGSSSGLDIKREFIDKYMDEALSTAIKNGVSTTINMNLASFALDLIKSDYSQDHTEAVLVIHTLASHEEHRTSTLSQIQSSPLCVSRLLDMVTSESHTDHRTKICIAEIVAHLARNLLLADISGATESISSMIDPYFTNISTLDTSVNIGHHEIYIDITTESKPLIIHGMLILAKLAANPDNCKEIFGSKGLFSKIISPVIHKVYEIPSDDDITMEITERALEVVNKLVSGSDETNRGIRREIGSNNWRIAVRHIRSIMDRECIYNKLKVPATKILTKLYLDRFSRIEIFYDIDAFIKVLMGIFFGVDNESGLRKTAGKALAVLVMNTASCTTIMNFSTGTENSVVQMLTTMIHDANNKLYQTAIAQLLTQFSAHSESDAERKALESTKTILHEVLKVICNIEQAENADQAGSPQPNPGHQQAEAPDLGAHHSRSANRDAPSENLPLVPQVVGARRKSLAAFLGLALQICHKQEITADAFDTALARIRLSTGEFVDKLNDIIEQCKCHSIDNLEGKGVSVEYLLIIKTLTKLCTWMIQSKPDCIIEFQSKNTSTKLQGALEDMRDLELSTILTGSAGDMANYETISSIVAAGRQKMDHNVLGTSR